MRSSSLNMGGPSTALASVAIVIPALNEANTIRHTLEPLQVQRKTGLQIVLVDGGSADGTATLAAPMVDRVISSRPGRAAQMNLGAAEVGADWLLFLHADTLLPPQFAEEICAAQRQGAGWGFFPVRLSGDHWLLRWVERGMNWRSRLTSVATGDQAMFVSRELWQIVGGFGDMPLMEDVDLSKRLRAQGNPYSAKTKLVTSSRRWEQRGVIKTILLMWSLRWRYFWGASPEELKKSYQ